MSSTDSRPTPARRPMGRPRRLDITRVVQAGVEVGLENLGISAVALRLGVSAAVIYTYVENLEQLRRLVVTALAKRPSLTEAGQHWADIARLYTDNLYSILSSEPGLLSQVVLGAIGQDEQLDELDAFIGLMIARGFDADAAMDIYQACGQIALGAAAISTMTVARSRRGIDTEAEISGLLAEESVDVHPHVRSLSAARISHAMGGDYRPVLEAFLASVALQRAEKLPPPAG